MCAGDAGCCAGGQALLQIWQGLEAASWIRHGLVCRLCSLRVSSSLKDSPGGVSSNTLSTASCVWYAFRASPWSWERFEGISVASRLSVQARAALRASSLQKQMFAAGCCAGKQARLLTLLLLQALGMTKHGLGSNQDLPVLSQRLSSRKLTTYLTTLQCKRRMQQSLTAQRLYLGIGLLPVCKLCPVALQRAQAVQACHT